jgi:tRNA-dihydrouridine synthase B
VTEVRGWLLEHLDDHLALYGEFTGVRSARKHIGWAVRGLPGGEALRQRINGLDEARAQHEALASFFDTLAATHERLPLPVMAAANDQEHDQDSEALAA